MKRNRQRRGERPGVENQPLFALAHPRQDRVHHSDLAEEVSFEHGLGIFQGVSSIAPSSPISALLTRTSIRPACAITSDTQAAKDCSEVTSRGAAGSP